MKLRVTASATIAALTVVLSAGPAAAVAGQPATRTVPTSTPIKHFIFLMQGGRSFDNYFGSFPGADGPPAGTCLPRVLAQPRHGCVKPFMLNGSLTPPLGASKSVIAGQYDHGKMNGFVAAYQRQGRNGSLVMGYYERRELPYYWNAASSYVLFDRFFSSARYGIRTNRSYWVSAAPAPGGTGAIPRGGYGKQPTIFDLLQAAGVSWKFYVEDYQPGETYRTASPANPATQTARVPLVDYRRFTQDPALAQHIVGLQQYYRDLSDGTLPDVAYITSAAGDNERSARSIAAGQSLVRNLVTQLMESRYWDSSALLWSYDSSGGWFDHVRPPRVHHTALGFRVPALLVSAYARRGQVNHTVVDYTSALKFIEENWRLPALTSRDAKANSLASAFDFAAGPRPPALIPAGPDALVQGLPGARPLPHAPVTRIYVLYGAAALAVLVFLFAAGWPARPGWLARRRKPAAERAPAVDGSRT
jgi:phospholipase C